MTRMLTRRAIPSRPYKRVVSTGNCCLVPKMVSSRMRFHSPKLARGTSVRARDATTTTNNIADFVSVPGAAPRAAALRTLGTGFTSTTAGDIMGCSFCFKTAGAGTSMLPALSGDQMYNIGLFVKTDAKGVLMSHVRMLEGMFTGTNVLVTTRYRRRSVVDTGAATFGRGCKRSPSVGCRPRVHDTRTYTCSSSLTVQLTGRGGTHLRVLRVDATRRLSLLRSGPLDRGGVATRTYISRLCFCSGSCRALGKHVGYGPSVGASRSQGTLHGTLSAGQVSMVNASRTPRLLGRGRKKTLGTMSNVPVVRFSLMTVVRLMHRNVLDVRRLIRGVYRTPTRLCRVREQNCVHPNCRTSLMLMGPSRR